MFLFGFDKIIKAFNWEKIIVSNYEESNFLGYKCAFLNSDYLYTIKDKDLFQDADIVNVLIEKLNKVHTIHINDVENYNVSRENFELDKLNTDIGITILCALLMKMDYFH